MTFCIITCLLTTQPQCLFVYLQVLLGNTAISVLGELSPGGILMHGTSQQQLNREYLSYIDNTQPLFTYNLPRKIPSKD